MTNRRDEGTATAAELLAERRAKGLTAADLPRSPGIYAEAVNPMPCAVCGGTDHQTLLHGVPDDQGGTQ